ncbi:unnamed protein product, partial [Prorocentrum cordatum]
MKRPAAAPPVHAAKSRRRAAGPALAGRASRSGDATMDGGGAVAAAVAAIPSGRTRTKMEVFRSALELMGRGDEAIGTGTRTGLAGARCAGWHRVVASDGGFWESRAAAHAQLRALRREGARPQLGEEARLHLGSVPSSSGTTSLGYAQEYPFAGVASGAGSLGLPDRRVRCESSSLRAFGLPSSPSPP